MNKEQLENLMENYYGTEHLYGNKMLAFQYSDGVKAFCENAGGGAYWFLDIVNSLFFEKKYKEKMGNDLISIHLVVKESKALITFKDSDGVFYDQEIEFTDCPDGDWAFYYDGGILFWNGEY